MSELFVNSVARLQSLALVERIGWLLVHSLWQFALVLALAALLDRLLRRASAATRYAWLLCALLSVAVLPALTWQLLPQPARLEMSLASAPLPPSPANAATSLPPSSAAGAAPTHDVDTAEVLGPSVGAPGGDVDVSGSLLGGTRIDAILRPWFGVIVSGWCLGVLLFSARLLWSWRTVRRMRSVGVSPVAQAVAELFQRTCERLNVAGHVQVLESTLVGAPVVMGCFRSVILLPTSFVSGVPHSQLEAILAHELAHVARHDYLANLLQTCVETLFFYHPAVWWLSHRIRVERENCCDDRAVSVLGNRAEYGRALLAVEEFRNARSSLALSATGGSLLARVTRLLANAPQDDRRPSGVWVALGVSMMALAVAVGAVASSNTAADASSVSQATIPRADEAKGRQFEALSDDETQEVATTAATEEDDAKPGPKDAAPMVFAESEAFPDSLNVMAVRFEGSEKLWSVATRRKVSLRSWKIGAGELSHVELETDQHANQYLHGELQLSADCSRVLAIHGGKILIWDVATGKLWKELEPPKGQRAHRGLSCSADGAKVACGTFQSTGFLSSDASTAIWDVATGKLLRSVTHVDAVQIQSTALSHDGRLLATGSQEAGLCVWEVSSGEQKFHHKNTNEGRKHPDGSVSLNGASQVVAVAFSPNRRQLAMADLLGVKLLDTTTGKLLQDCRHPFRFGRSALVFSSKGHRLARVGTDKTIPIWSTRTGGLMVELDSESHTGSFSEDNKHFAIGKTDQKDGVRVWQSQPAPKQSKQPKQSEE